MDFKNTVISFMLFLFIMVPFATASIDVQTYAASKDFTVTSAYDKASICSCATKYDSINITNTGTWPAIFTVNVEGGKSKISLPQNSVELAPGQSASILMYITADCSAGTDDIKITVTSNLGPQKSLGKTIVRDRCQNIEMQVANYTKDIAPCQPRIFEITIHNVGEFQDNYAIKSNYDKYITYNAKTFSLEPNQFIKVSATLNLDCKIYGTQDIRFTVSSEKNRLTAAMDAPLNVIRDYDYDLKINNNANESASLQVCNRVSSLKVPVIVKNKGSVANNYTIYVDGLPKYAKIEGLEYNTFSLNPGESRTFNIDIDSTSYRYEHKSKEITIGVIPKYGDIFKESKLALELQPCYEHEVILYDGGKSAKHPLETCSGYEYSYDVEVYNKGSFKENYRLSLDGAPSTVRLSTDKITVEPGQRESVKLLITGPEYDEYYNIKVYAALSDKASGGIIESDDTWIKTYTSQSCHATAITGSGYKINYQDQAIKIPVINDGIADNTYAVFLEGSDIAHAEDHILAIEKGGKGTVTVSINSIGADEGTYNNTLTLKDASGAAYSKDISITLKDKSKFVKGMEYLAFGSICRQFSLLGMLAILAVIAIIIIFLIAGPHYPYKFTNRLKAKTSAMIFLIVLFLIGLILIVLIAGFPKSQDQVYNLTSNDSELTYEWLQDDKFTLEMDKFFYDPEGTTLRYNVTGLEHIKARINDKTITFIPDWRWSGIEYGKITAYDNMGGSVESPEFTFIVRDVPRKSNIELYSIYCWYVNLAIFAIILFLAFVAIFVKQKKRARK